MFVIDSCDRVALNLAKLELEKLLGNKELKGVFFLVLANKQDMKEAMGPEDIARKMGLDEVTDHSWSIHGVSAAKGTGLEEAFDWLVHSLQAKG